MAAVLFFAARLYVDWLWLTSGFGKITDGFNPGGFLQGAVADPVMEGGRSGPGLMVGLFTTTAAFFGGTMNFAFLLAGTVSTNPVMLILAILLLVGKGNAGSIGLDRFVPTLKENIGRKPKEQHTSKAA